MAFDSEDFAYPPSGGRNKLVLLGILLPGFIAWHAAHAWIARVAYWPSRRGAGIVIHGEAARAMAVLYLSVALFIHFRWFWGLLQKDRAFLSGTVGSCLLFLGALLWALACV